MRAVHQPFFAAPVGGKHVLLAIAGGLFGLGLAVGTVLDPALQLRAPSINSAFFRSHFAGGGAGSPRAAAV